MNLLETVIDLKAIAQHTAIKTTRNPSPADVRSQSGWLQPRRS